MNKWLISLLLILLTPASWALDLACGHVVPIQKKFLSRHIVYMALSKNLEVRTIDQYLKHLDPSKLYFTMDDVKKIKKDMDGVFDRTSQGECEPILDTYALLKTRIKENANFAKTYLSTNFKFDPKTKLMLDAEKRGYAKNKAAATEFQKKYIQLQVANYIAADSKEAEAVQKVIKNYDRALKRIEEDKPGDVLSNYLDSFATALDPHTTYWSKDAYDEFEISIRLSLEGIGATLSSKDGFTVVEQLIPGGSAAKSNQLKAKDMITSVGQGEDGPMEDVIDLELRDVVKKIRGKKGTKVRLSILRKEPEGNKKFQLVLVRDKISIEDEAASITYLDREAKGKKVKVGLVNLPSFYADNRTGERSSATDMKKLMREARQNNVDTMVLDLSSNGGGSLQDAVDIAGLYFGEGNVVKQSSRDPLNGEIVLFDKDPLVDYPGPLVILTSRVTASASEIVAGTLKDYKRAVIVGADHTFGKGTVQAVEDLPQKLGAIKTTIGLYFIPGGESTQHIGVPSDITFPSALSTDEIGEKTLDYSLAPKHIKPFLSPQAYIAEGKGAWQLVDKRIVSKLKVDSDKRIATSTEFKKIKDDIAKVKKRTQGEVIIGEFIKEKEDASKEQKEDDGKDYAETQAAKKERYLKRADIQEAINIAAEMAVYEGGGSDLKLGAKTTSQKPESQVDPQSND